MLALKLKTVILLVMDAYFLNEYIIAKEIILLTLNLKTVTRLIRDAYFSKHYILLRTLFS